MANIVVIGSLNMDLIAVAPRLPIPGETLTGLRYLNEPGGKGANQAYAAAKLGGDVAMFGRVGADDYGERMRANLSEVGCNIAAVRAIDESSGVAMIFVAESGENSIVVVPGANLRYLPSDFQADAPSLAGAGLVLLQLETPLETVSAAAQEAHRRGARVILDPAPAPPKSSPALLRYVDILTPNEAEAAQLVNGSPAQLNLEEARAVSGTLRAMGARTVIIKLGAQGCLLAEGETAILIPAPKVNVVDTTGAGDVFNAALAVASSEGASLVEACRFAVRAAALSVTRLGAQRSVPSRAELGSFAG
ncbi:MAG TPA: ribokinase [Steroidobacteraceae bacterium]|nr:ribokinase [Steroidobacteraceae bacterium]